MFAKLLAIVLKRRDNVVKYRTKFYLRKVQVDDKELIAGVEPVSPYLFRTREKEYFGILREVKNSEKVIDAKLVQLAECKLSNGDTSRCFMLKLAISKDKPFETAIIGKSVDTIVEIEFITDGDGTLTVHSCVGLADKLEANDTNKVLSKIDGKDSQLQLTSICAG